MAMPPDTCRPLWTSAIPFHPLPTPAVPSGRLPSPKEAPPDAPGHPFRSLSTACDPCLPLFSMWLPSLPPDTWRPLQKQALPAPADPCRPPLTPAIPFRRPRKPVDAPEHLPMPPDPYHPLVTLAIPCRHPPMCFEACLLCEMRTGRGLNHIDFSIYLSKLCRFYTLFLVKVVKCKL